MGIVGLRSTKMKENNGNTSKALKGGWKSGAKRESETVENQPTDKTTKKKSETSKLIIENRRKAEAALTRPWPGRRR